MSDTFDHEGDAYAEETERLARMSFASNHARPKILVSANGRRQMAWEEPIEVMEARMRADGTYYSAPYSSPDPTGDRRRYDKKNDHHAKRREQEEAMPEANARTMYDMHKGSTGSIMICMMDDAHLRNTIRVIATNFINQREKLTPNTTVADPMIQAMTRNQCWGPERLESETKSVLRNLAPYIMECVVRGEGILQEAQMWIQRITKRKEGVASPNEVILLTVDQDELP